MPTQVQQPRFVEAVPGVDAYAIVSRMLDHGLCE